MKKNIIAAMALMLSLGALQTTYAQEKPGVGIGAKKVDNSAILEIQSKNKGVLIPRMPLLSLTTFDLEGKSGTESMLIYNNKPGVDEIPTGFYYWDTTKWELITSQSVLNQAIENLRTDVYNKIDEITTIQPEGSTDKSYLVAFTPDKDEPNKGKFSYLVKNETTGEYDLVSISFEDLIKASETNTFILEKEGLVLNDKKEEVKTTVGYYYFGEDLIKEWIGAGNDILNIDPESGTFIDVAGIADSTFISNLVKNEEFIKETFINIEGNITLHGTKEDGYYFETVEKDGTITKTLFNDMETQTSMGRGEVTADGGVPTFTANQTEPTAVKKGEIYYEYITEGDRGQVKNYISLTADLITSITNNEDLKNEINNVVNNFVEGGSNVYYGKLDPSDPNGKNVLFTMDKDKNKTLIDISQNIINEINDNQEVQNTILNLIKLDIVNDFDKKTNTFFNGKEIYKGTQVVSVSVDNPSTLSSPVLIKPQREIINNGVPELIPDNTVKLGRLLSIQVLDADGSVVVSNFTDLKITRQDTEFNFDFGQGIMYFNLAAGNYQLIYEYVSK